MASRIGRAGWMAVGITTAWLMAACGGGSSGSDGTSTTPTPTPTPTPGPAPTPAPAPAYIASPPAPSATLSEKASVGNLIFRDGRLSASGIRACANCHIDTNHFVGIGGAAGTPTGGLNSLLPGARSTSSLTYLAYVPGFLLTADGTPYGGLQADGRAASLAAQAHLPLMTTFEMANTSLDSLRAIVASRPYTPRLTALYGNGLTTDGQAAIDALGDALQAFQIESSALRPFDSRYDWALKGQLTLTAREQNGLKLFNDPAKGNCASCHTSTAVGSVPPLFTNHGYAALGVPRNYGLVFNRHTAAEVQAQTATLPSYIPANGATYGAGAYAFYDLGLCGPFRTDLTDSRYCGMFRTPSLRNVALRPSFFHNGAVTSLRLAVEFKATRDSNPGAWYLKADGSPDVAYNDLPPTLRANVEQKAPFGKAAAALSSAEIDDIVVFLCALIDGYDPTGYQPALGTDTNPRPLNCPSYGASPAN